jgi:hypothetical protein
MPIVNEGPLVAAALTVALAVACRAIPSETTAIMNGPSLAVRVGQEVLPTGSNAFGVTLLSVEQDSRCPRSVVCVTAGTADIVIGYRFGRGPTVPVRLRWGAAPRDTVVGSVRIVFDSLAPYPDMPGPLLAQDRYTAWLSFTP